MRKVVYDEDGEALDFETMLLEKIEEMDARLSGDIRKTFRVLSVAIGFLILLIFGVYDVLR
jgi:hypothetical protein